MFVEVPLDLLEPFPLGFLSFLFQSFSLCLLFLWCGTSFGRLRIFLRRLFLLCWWRSLLLRINWSCLCSSILLISYFLSQFLVPGGAGCGRLAFLDDLFLLVNVLERLAGEIPEF